MHIPLGLKRSIAGGIVRYKGGGWGGIRRGVTWGIRDILAPASLFGEVYNIFINMMHDRVLSSSLL